MKKKVEFFVEKDHDSIILHLIADLPAGDGGADGDDGAGALEARVRAGALGRGVQPLPLDAVGAVEGGGGDLDAAGSERRSEGGLPAGGALACAAA